jgi:23S rRNA pseudouridine1911/1915/1917 synthase
MAVTERGKPAVTDYVVLDTFDEPAPVTLVQCKLHTGRTHQIRVHLRAIGHPVLGDDRYGGRKASVPVPRLFLHAATLGFTHPRTGEPMSFDSPLPADLATVLAGLSTRAD